MKIFGYEPALIIGAVSAGLSLLVTFNTGMSAETAAGWTALITAAFTVATAVMTRPIAPAAFTGAVTAAAGLLAAYGFDVSTEAVGGVNAFVLTVLTLVTRGQVSPTVTPSTRPVSGV